MPKYMPSEILKMQSILVVDDEPDFLELLCFQLQSYGLSCRKAHSGNEAIKLVIGQEVNFIVSDIVMPDGDGIDLMRTIKLRDLNKITLMFITGYSKYSQQQMNLMGASAVLHKPLDFNYLVKTMDDLILKKTPKEFRKEPRHPTNIEAEIILVDGNRRGAKVINLSRGGVLLSHQGNDLSKGIYIHAELKLSPYTNETVRFVGVVRWNISQEDQSQLLGIEFLHMDKNSSESLHNFINQLLVNKAS